MVLAFYLRGKLRHSGWGRPCNRNYNSDIAWVKISFGCAVKFSDSVKFPTEFYMLIKTELVEKKGR